MKFLGLLATVLCFSNFILAQNKDLQTQSESLYWAHVNHNLDSISILTHPKTFSLLQQSQYRMLMKSQLTGTDDFTVTINKVKPTITIGKTVKNDSVQASIISFPLAMELKMKKQLSDREIQANLEIFKKAFQTNQISFDKNKNSLILNRKTTFIAVNDKGSNYEWLFILLDPDKVLVNHVLGEQLTQNLLN